MSSISSADSSVVPPSVSITQGHPLHPRPTDAFYELAEEVRDLLRALPKDSSSPTDLSQRYDSYIALPKDSGSPTDRSQRDDSYL
ncbi:hypothetical protein CHS0354_033752 [Potamilus streckersoni]|uniref:Uncharacterized protein n=1 Tax=Potamilus streckersoni TaxID=2493646 RepID=A0AAE0S2N9_9BIVA|nr:hypothetical protein CHS0354_033752 [Potamilus streckersoni]